VLGTSTIASAQSIDAWEPVKTGSAIPSTATVSSVTGSAWIGYSDGSVYFTSSPDSAAPSWQRMDQGLSTKVVTTIAAADSYDEYIAYVGYNSSAYDSEVYRVMYAHGNVNWTKQLSVPGLIGVSTAPGVSSNVYVAASGGVLYSKDSGATWSSTNAANDPLTPPSGCAISAVGGSKRHDIALVGCTNGDVFSVMGLKSGSPQWTRLDNGYYSPLPDRMVTRLQIDERDAGGKTFLAVFSGTGTTSTWITRTGGSAWLPASVPVTQVAGPYPNILTASLSPAPSGTTLYAQGVNLGAVRSDDDGATWFRTPRWSGRNVAVEYRRNDSNVTGNEIKASFRVKNLGSVPFAMDSIAISYAFTPDGNQAQTYTCFYSDYGCQNISGTVAGGTLMLDFVNVHATVPAGQSSGRIDVRVNKNDWSAYNQSNDISFIASATDWTLNRKIVLQDSADAWLWGLFSQ
jgi:hypothetical protein